MHTPLAVLMRALNRKLVGYYRYYGITDNSKAINSFTNCVRIQLFKVLNRRSQINSYNWDTFNLMIKRYKLAPAKIYVNLFEGKVSSKIL